MKKETGVIYRTAAWFCLNFLLFGICYLIMGLQYYGPELMKIQYTGIYDYPPYCYPEWFIQDSNRNLLIMLVAAIALPFLIRKLAADCKSRNAENQLYWWQKVPVRFIDLEMVLLLLVTGVSCVGLYGWPLYGALSLVSLAFGFTFERLTVLAASGTWADRWLVKYLGKNLGRTGRALLLGGALFVIKLALTNEQILVTISTYGIDPIMLWQVLAVIELVGVLLLAAFLADFGRLTKRVSDMAQGVMSEETLQLGRACQPTAERLMAMEDGMREAIEERVRGERLKTELITNVSHDLKTPLTSVVNYVQLLKREPATSEQAAHYLEILEQKTLQMRQLTEDIIEFSRLVSNNVEVEKEELNFSEMVRQANGEFAEMFESRGLEVRCRQPEEDCVLPLDGKKTWRVLENLYMNVSKYAMGYTRVYVEVADAPGAVHFTIKNISEQVLAQSPEELMERFVRGDQSRTTEGNGLGLSIAKSLVEIQGGTFEIELNGDLFVAKVKLPR